MLGVVCLVRGAHYAFEQPGSSVMCKMEQFQHVFRTAFKLGFGTTQLKRLFLGIISALAFTFCGSAVCVQRGVVLVAIFQCCSVRS